MNNQNNQNWNAGMEMMAAMMSMFGGAVQQPKAPPTPVAAPPPPPPEISSDYGYSAGPNTYDRNQRGKFNQSNHRGSGRFTQGGYGRQSGGKPAPPPPPPPPQIREDIPLPPEYSYPRHLEPDIAKHAKAREESERVGWKRKTDNDYEEDMKRAKSDPESVGNALSKAAERAKAINSKLGSTGTKFQENAPGSSFIETDKEHEMYNKMVTYAVPVPAMKDKGTIANVPFQTQQGTQLVQIIININKRYSVYTGLTH